MQLTILTADRTLNLQDILFLFWSPIDLQGILFLSWSHSSLVAVSQGEVSIEDSPTLSAASALLRELSGERVGTGAGGIKLGGGWRERAVGETVGMGNISWTN